MSSGDRATTVAPFLRVAWNPGQGRLLAHTYRIAQRILYSDVEMDLPAAEVTGHHERAVIPVSVLKVDVQRTVYRGDGFFSGSIHDVECRHSPSGYTLTVNGVCNFHIDPTGVEIHRLSAGRRIDHDVFLGPVLTLALALQGVFTLHASVIETGGQAICFLGASGSGKSTTAAHLAQQVPSARCLADDMAPVFMTERLNLVPDYPQKEMTTEPDPLHSVTPVPVAGLVWLEPDTEGNEGIYPLTSRQVVGRLITSTSCTKLFAPGLLQRHLAFCGNSAGSTKGFVSTGPRQPRTLLAIRDLVATGFDG